MLLEGKKIIVTGGLSGIGKATVLGMARHGAQLVSMSRADPTEERAKIVVEAATELGKHKISHVKVDVRDQSSVDAAFAEAITSMGGLDAMVNCAGVEQRHPAEDLTAELLYDQFAVHVMGTAFTNTAAFRHYKRLYAANLGRRVLIRVGV